LQGGACVVKDNKVSKTHADGNFKTISKQFQKTAKIQTTLQ
jgi:hypothetical protein